MLYWDGFGGTNIQENVLCREVYAKMCGVVIKDINTNKHVRGN